MGREPRPISVAVEKFRQAPAAERDSPGETLTQLTSKAKTLGTHGSSRPVARGVVCKGDGRAGRGVPATPWSHQARREDNLADSDRSAPGMCATLGSDTNSRRASCAPKVPFFAKVSFSIALLMGVYAQIHPGAHATALRRENVHARQGQHASPALCSPQHGQWK